MRVDGRVLEEIDPLRLDPPYAHADYVSTALRAPRGPLLRMPDALETPSAPVFGEHVVDVRDHDLTLQHDGEPHGERISVEGRLLDGGGRPVAGKLLELWQANASGRYAHVDDDHRAPLDPNFTGYGRCLSGDDGSFRFVTVKPGAYPWHNHENAWRPAHLHLSVFGRGFADRLVTQMYFPGDPLLELDPIFNSVRDARARDRLVARFDLDLTTPDWSLGYRHDIVVGGRSPTPVL